MSCPHELETFEEGIDRCRLCGGLRSKKDGEWFLPQKTLDALDLEKVVTETVSMYGFAGLTRVLRALGRAADHAGSMHGGRTPEDVVGREVYAHASSAIGSCTSRIRDFVKRTCLSSWDEDA